MGPLCAPFCARASSAVKGASFLGRTSEPGTAWPCVIGPAFAMHGTVVCRSKTEHAGDCCLSEPQGTLFACPVPGLISVHWAVRRPGSCVTLSGQHVRGKARVVHLDVGCVAHDRCMQGGGVVRLRPPLLIHGLDMDAGQRPCGVRTPLAAMHDGRLGRWVRWVTIWCSRAEVHKLRPP